MSSFTIDPSLAPAAPSIPTLEQVQTRPACHIIVGMAGSGKTTYMAQLVRKLGSGEFSNRTIIDLTLLLFASSFLTSCVNQGFGSIAAFDPCRSSTVFKPSPSSALM